MIKPGSPCSGWMLLALLVTGPAHAAAQSSPPTPVDEAIQKTSSTPDDDDRFSFLRWLHTDVFWIPTENDNPTYGLIGVHMTVARLGRVDVYGPPGVMLLRQRVGSEWMLRPGFTWGISIRLSDMRMPGLGRPVTLFLNVAKCWTHGDYRNGMDLAGLSITWKK